MDANQAAITLMRQEQVLQTIPLSRTTLLKMVKKGIFPKPIKIGRVCFWMEEEVQDFIRRKAQESRR